MGKDLNGKELGEGLYQRADGRYYARFRIRNGHRLEKGFPKLAEAKAWRAEQMYKEAHGNVAMSNRVTMDAWFDYIMTVKSENLHKSSIDEYKNRYRRYIKDNIGNMLLDEIRPPHCQLIVSDLQKKGHYSTAKAVWVLLAVIFNYAVDSEMLEKSPMTNAVQYNKKKSRPKETKILNTDEQEKLIEYMKSIDSAYITHFCFILQTGLRLGELIGLKWEDVDWTNRTIHIQRSTKYDFGNKCFVDGPPKYEASDRIIPLTEEAYSILKQRRKIDNGRIISMQCRDYVFLNRHGKMSDHGIYEKALLHYCERAGITRVTPHGLRHTFATRCIEAGILPKNLQKIMGHERITMTMELYVHATDDGIVNDMRKLMASGY